MSILKTLTLGQDYLNMYPSHPKLAMIFPEPRVIKSTQFAQKMMPLIAVLSLVWALWIVKGNNMALVAAVITALFALGIPLQGLYWLGKRAKTPLSVSSQLNFDKICTQLRQAKGALPSSLAFQQNTSPTYYDLALLLNQADKQLGEQFWDEI
ncbi:MAG: terminus macrodomain insulation protein YfbV [Pasteurellaceae bacterium]|nr:terminus macrodomain insulation protein YfbV [Pasteurellaceae bacterium]